MAGVGRVSMPGRATAEAVLRSYAQVLFSRGLVPGGLLLLATLAVPRVGLSGLAAVLVSVLVSRTLTLPEDSVRDGLLGYNALLVGLGVGAVLPLGVPWLLLLTAGAVASVLLTAALRALLTVTWALPIYTLPFLLVLPAVWGAMDWMQLARAPAMPLLPEGAGPTALATLGALFFVPRAEAGALVLLALAVHSRIGVLLGLGGLALAFGLAGLSPSFAEPGVTEVLGFNVALVVIALGGVWFVPSPSAFAVAFLGGGLAALLTAGALPLATRLGLPLLVLPFNATMLVGLMAMRQRVRDRSPKSVDFLIGSPEENLHHHHTRVARFGAHYATRFHAPYLGGWTCTQGTEGPHTHRGLWSQAADFEVLGPDGRPHRDDGSRREHYRCWRLPVLAVADGVVARVVDGVPDNAVGEIDAERNWGNLVVVRHAPGVHSLVAHLEKGSVAVKEGEVVRRGDTLGRCGASGRAPTPHLHLQLQASALPGDATTVLELHDVVREGEDGPRFVATTTPAEGDLLRNVEPDDGLVASLAVPPGACWRFDVVDGERTWTEEVRAEVDLYGASWLRSERGTALSWELRDGVFTVYDVLGPRGSVLHALHAALPRMPLERRDGLTWTDHLPVRRFLPRLLRLVLDPVWAVLGPGGLATTYTLRLDDGRVVVEGVSAAERSGVPRVRTLVVLGADGPERVELHTGGRTVVATRHPDAPESP